MIHGVDYYKHTQGLFNFLTPDGADELIGSRESLQEELGRSSPSLSVGIAEDPEGYYLVVDGADGDYIPSEFNGWRVVSSEEGEFSR